MFQNDYKNELDSLTLSDDFKNNTVSLMMTAAGSPVAYGSNKTVIFPKRTVKNLIAACFIFAVCLYSGVFISQKFDFIDSDSARETVEMDFYNNEKDSETDSISPEVANGVFNQSFTYSAADRREISPVADYDSNRVRDKSIRKPVLTVDNSGGMGFEAYIMKNPAELEQNPAYTVGDEFDSLPVYSSVLPDAQKYTREITDILNRMECSYSPFTYVWSYPVYDDDGNHTSNGQVETDSPLPPTDRHFISYIRTTFTDKNGNTGNIEIFSGRGQLWIGIDKYLSAVDKTEYIVRRINSNYPGLFSQNTKIRTEFDYNIYGEINYHSYMYEPDDDYGVNIYNSSMGTVSMTMYPGGNTGITSVRIPMSACWQKEENLPAIDYTQALSLMYDGVYYSSCFEDITPDTEVSHIELVYKPGYYNMPFERYECYTLPFYKFYVDITDSSGFNYPAENLRTYAAYYVCAIHPDFIEIGPDSGYASFN